MSDTLFTQEAAAPQAQPTSSLFSVGGREYDAEAAVKKIENADAFIEQLKAEKRELEEKLAQAKTVEDAMRLVQQQQAAPVPPPVVEAPAPVMDVQAMMAQMQQLAQQQAQQVWQTSQAEALAQQNVNASLSAVKAAYGDEYQQKVLARGAELGYDQAGIDSLAKTNPKVFQELFVPKAPLHQPSPHTQSRGVASLQPELNDVLPNFSSTWSSGDKVNQLFQAELAVAEMMKNGTLKV